MIRKDFLRIRKNRIEKQMQKIYTYCFFTQNLHFCKDRNHKNFQNDYILKYSFRILYRRIMDKLLSELKVKIVKTLNLTDIHPEEIDADARLVGGRMGLDSIDVLELVMMMEKDYAVKIDNKEIGAKVFASLRSMAEYITDHSPVPAG